MAFDCGAGDIIAGIRIALTIYEYGFTEENAADVRYQEFQNDILNFSLLLERLDRSLRDAQRRFIDGGMFARAQGAYDPMAPDFDAERIALIGNFQDTLRACEALLGENRKYRERYATVLESLMWHLKQQETRIDNLRRRLRFHCDKIRLVIDRLSLNLLTSMDSKLDDLLGITEENLAVSQDIYDELRRLRQVLIGRGSATGDQPTEDVHHATPDVERRFEAALFINTPTNLSSGLPLIEAFDALYSCFEDSVESLTQTPHKYLLLLKSRWLISRIKQSEEYLRARPGFYYRRAINQVDQGIRLRIRSGHVKAFDERVLLSLPEKWFEIWPPPTPRASTILPEPHPLSVRANEQEVARIELAADEGQATHFVTVFKHSDDNFRITKETSTATGQRVITTQQVYTREDTLIPRYTLPTLPSSSPEVAIFSRNELTFYHFKSEEDLWRFQAALTGYDVSHDQPDVLCQFGRSLDSFVCNGRAQLWQDPIVFSSQPGAIAPGIPSARSNSDKGASISRSRQPSFAPSVAHTNTFTYTADGWIAENIKLPALVLFTQLEHGKNINRFAVVYIELVEGIEIDRNACSCKDDYYSCSKLVISGGKKGRLPVRIAVSELDDSGKPNPNTFDVLPFRLPRRPDYKDIKLRHTEHVVLKFSNLEAKQRFDRGLKYRFAVREKQRENADTITDILIYNSNKPLRRDQYLLQNVSRRNSIAGSLPAMNSVQTLPPHLEVPEWSSFSDDVAHATDSRPIRGSHNVSGSTSMSGSYGTNVSGGRSASSNSSADHEVNSNTTISPRNNALLDHESNASTACDTDSRQLPFQQGCTISNFSDFESVQ
ncbi:uncharacterized protein HMPREF1541_04311 [Cyphellophora europaea CBS 101466]|uniref:Uncharacterized protein n=1 Tax=Cyphellophora europaea (strain CBS 101466) TaxID=1220924 RepID=W2RU57_CYPE1|nr:uncharacterized protein HMPREF1541_04311 [Cyphellophora europaea CBS 101466]ETN40036.1 hypothetical protein HMPREF1541_04311 [Cyphellophora europaea CBS 101466]